MRKIVLIIHTSIDGFVAGENGEFDELVQSPENLDFVCSLTEKADAVLAGRMSFQMLDSYWPTAHKNPDASASEVKYSNWYNSTEKIVLSKSFTEKKGGSVKILSENIKDGLLQMKNKKGKNILLFGSPSVYKALTKLNLIDEYWMIVYPVLLGKGIPLFDDLKTSVKLKCLSSKQFSKGEIAIHYSVEN
ncbi:dihydrofolate reductase family protein [Arenibacter sp. M-2]|uniref:dihydrofolate reductase family protein n=1 Tax=Arenibacter sp. M-2 TaxID=3053612 RepID=UPI0025709964|nr:dihydrofolate reductase family protein [Arenibacter sp. M-2]MDL5511132.1 dihydrofolate reductase family protein [Arenibacter sp. M-2]